MAVAYCQDTAAPSTASTLFCLRCRHPWPFVLRSGDSLARFALRLACVCGSLPPCQPHVGARHVRDSQTNHDHD